MKYTLTVKYKIGSVLETADRKYTLLGYEHIEGRGLRYAYLIVDNGKPDWIYLYDFEIEAMQKKP